MKIFVTCFALLAIHPLLRAQELVGSGGDLSTNGTETLSWSLGEISTQTVTFTPNTLTQGFQQVDRRDVAVEELFAAHISVYPVPFQSVLTISSEKLTGNYTTSVFNSAGQRVFEGPDFTPESSNLSLNLASLEHGIYILLLEDTSSGKQFFRRIIKT